MLHDRSRKKTISANRLLLGACFAGIVFVASTCGHLRRERQFSGVIHANGQEFAGSATCVTCHPSITQSHSHTPHFLTSQQAAPETVLGSFDAPRNVLALNERLKVVMEKTPEGLFQAGFAGGVEVERKPFDIVVGSGRQGQTYLYWQGNSLFQLPVSYHSETDTWTNSPGYPREELVFNRNIPARCLECHSTYFRIGKSAGARETFDRDQVMLGVDCERCHGPAAGHVAFHLDHPGEKTARHIVNPAKLSRQQRLDNCALCHSGIRNNFMPSFTFMVGDRLDDFSSPVYGADSAATLDVHGNQYGLLTSSKCFRMSKSLDCSSCHDVHVKETHKLEVFSARCMSCHKRESDNFCTQPEVPGLTLTANCIDCHMPRLPSRQVFLGGTANVKPTPFYVRTHLVGKYEAQVRSFLERITHANAGHAE